MALQNLMKTWRVVGYLLLSSKNNAVFDKESCQLRLFLSTSIHKKPKPHRAQDTMAAKKRKRACFQLMVS